MHFKTLLERSCILKWLFCFIVSTFPSPPFTIILPKILLLPKAVTAAPFNHVLFGVSILPFILEVYYGPMVCFQCFYEGFCNQSHSMYLKMQSIKSFRGVSSSFSFSYLCWSCCWWCSPGHSWFLGPQEHIDGSCPIFSHHYPKPFCADAQWRWCSVSLFPNAINVQIATWIFAPPSEFKRCHCNLKYFQSQAALCSSCLNSLFLTCTLHCHWSSRCQFHPRWLHILCSDLSFNLCLLSMHLTLFV